MKSIRFSRSHGFTLVELLVVVTIIAVLVTVTATATIRFRASADRAATLGALRQLQMANLSHAAENADSFVPPEAKEVDASGTETGVVFRWFENPNFISHLKGEAATFSGSGSPDISVPAGLLDAVVIRKKTAKDTNLGNSFGYTTPPTSTALKKARLSNASVSAAFITCDKPFVEHATKSDIAYRHQDKALVVYYDGSAAVITKSDVARYDTNGGATNSFWKAVTD